MSVWQSTHDSGQARVVSSGRTIHSWISAVTGAPHSRGLHGEIVTPCATIGR